ncbi:MAG: adenosine-specific kinase [Deltaproteobacteria bacterium]|nr:adenosine-specific kinase [Deltaproteobacteria bacterium]
MSVTLEAVPITKPEDVNVIVGQSHFIKTVEDLHEALAGSGPGIRFGVAFCEASGPCLIRLSGNDAGLVALARDAASGIGAGHSFVVLLRGAFPIQVLRAIREVPEVCSILCATANDVEVIVASTARGRGIVGVVDGASPKGVETEDDARERKELLRRFGYKL